MAMTQTITVVYSSKTGNTKRVAEAIAAACETEALALTADMTVATDMVAVGYWVDKGMPNAEALHFLESLNGKKVFLFGTLGADADSEHATRTKENARNLIAERNVLLGEFLCQGAIDPKLIEMFKQFPPDHPHAITPERLARYARAAKHPDAADLAAAQAAIRAALELSGDA